MILDAAAQWSPGDEARLVELLRAEYGGESMDGYIRRVSPRHPPPRHIRPIIDVWERTRHERVFVLIELPPRHAKTTTGLHGLGWRLRRDPAVTNGFATFGDDYAASRSRIARTLTRAGGVELSKEMANLHEWRTTFGGGLLAHGYQGEWTGQGINGVLLIDDPFKDRKAAESKLIRQNVWEWFTDVAWTRLEEQSSVIVQHTRWHEDDLIGRLKAGKFPGYKWECIHLPAIAEDDDLLGRQVGEALWPERVSLDELHRIEMSIGPYSWASLFQQRPRPRGSDLFREPARYFRSKWIADGHRILLCCDPAATEDTRADYSAAFILAARGYGDDMEIWVLHGWRNQVEMPVVARKLYELSRRHWNAPVAVESVGAFKGVPQMLREIEPKLRILEINPQGDKFTRAQAVVVAWNAGRVHIPLDAEIGDSREAQVFRRTWADELISEATDFTGVGDEHDDQVDAMAHGFNTMWAGTAPRGRGASRNRHPFG